MVLDRPSLQQIAEALGQPVGSPAITVLEEATPPLTPMFSEWSFDTNGESFELFASRQKAEEDDGLLLSRPGPSNYHPSISRVQFSAPYATPYELPLSILDVTQDYWDWSPVSSQELKIDDADEVGHRVDDDVQGDLLSLNHEASTEAGETSLSLRLRRRSNSCPAPHTFAKLEARHAEASCQFVDAQVQTDVQEDASQIGSEQSSSLVSSPDNNLTDRSIDVPVASSTAWLNATSRVTSRVRGPSASSSFISLAVERADSESSRTGGSAGHPMVKSYALSGKASQSTSTRNDMPPPLPLPPVQSSTSWQLKGKAVRGRTQLYGSGLDMSPLESLHEVTPSGPSADGGSLDDVKRGEPGPQRPPENLQVRTTATNPDSQLRRRSNKGNAEDTGENEVWWPATEDNIERVVRKSGLWCDEHAYAKLGVRERTPCGMKSGR